MPYADPVTAAFALACSLLVHASQQPSVTVTCGRLLARALEFAGPAATRSGGPADDEGVTPYVVEGGLAPCHTPVGVSAHRW